VRSLIKLQRTFEWGPWASGSAQFAPFNPFVHILNTTERTLTSILTLLFALHVSIYCVCLLTG